MSRKRRADKDKVSPGFEGVAPAVDPGGPANDDGTVSRGRRLRSILVRTLSSCCCFWRKAGQSTKKAVSREAHTHAHCTRYVQEAINKVMAALALHPRLLRWENLRPGPWS